MEVLWAVLCQSSSVDRDSNNVSLFNVMEEVRLPTGVQVVPIQPEDGPEGAIPTLGLFQLVILYSRSDEGVAEKTRVKISVFAPGVENPLIFSESEVDLSQYLRLRQRVNFPGFPVPTPEPVAGTYEFIVDGKTADGEWEEMARVPLRVVVDS